MRFLIYILIIAYVLSPFDLLPDFMIGVGWIDDLLVLGILYWYHYVYKDRKRRSRWSYQKWQQGSTENNREEFKEGRSSKREQSFQEKTGDRDPYKVLGVKRGAPVDEIKTAYKRLAHQYHPDKVIHLGEEFRDLAETRFKEIQTAYQDIMTN